MIDLPPREEVEKLHQQVMLMHAQLHQMAKQYPMVSDYIHKAAANMTDAARMIDNLIADD